MELLSQYAELLIKKGLNVQSNQSVYISCPIECADLARACAQSAYRTGAKEVVVNWIDDKLSRIRFEEAPDFVFDTFPMWRKAMLCEAAEEGACFLSISASDPEIMKGVSPDRMMRQQKATNTSVAPYRERLMSNRNAWCVASMPTVSWAVKVFPEVSENEAVEMLLRAIMKTVRADTENPVSAWDDHLSALKRRVDFLNENRFHSLRYTNAAGTDVLVGLVEDHIWAGGSEYTPEGVEFIANMPTEEVFTMPCADRVNGVIKSSMPLVYQGNIIDRFSLTFKDGQVVDYSAEVGYENLKGLLDTDDGARRLGEVALVQFDSPISNSGILFYNTLFDENASCHFAFGKAYPINIENGAELSASEKKAKGVNDSLTHVDFMVGSADLAITGIKKDGEEVAIFRNGNFVI